MTSWQPIETAPRDGVCLLLADGNYIEFGYHDHGRWMIVNNGDYTDGGYGRDYETGKPSSFYGTGYAHPTHWMPLPEPPND